MAGTLDQFLRPGERVIYRTPRPWPPRYRRSHGLAILALGFGLFALNEWTAFDWSSLVTPRLIGLLFPVIIALIIIFAERCKTEVAVTDRRLLRAGPHGPQLGFRSIDLAEVATVELLFGAVRLTKRNGEIFNVDHPSYAPKIALAAARAAGRPPPRVPDRKARIVSHAISLTSFTALLATYVVAVRILAAAGLLASFPLCLFVLLPTIPAAVAAWVLVELLALIVVRRFFNFNRAEMERCFRLLGLISRDPAHPDQPNWFGRVRLRLFDLVYGPPNPGVARHGG